MKVVFHVNELSKLSESRHNIQNLLIECPRAQIILVVNGAAIQGYLLPNQIQFMEKYPQVAFHACQNAMQAQHITAMQLVKQVEIVPAGVSDLIKLQEAGYAYIKP